MRSAVPANLPPSAHRLRKALRDRDGRRAWDALTPQFIARGFLGSDPRAWWGLFLLCQHWGFYRRVERLGAQLPRSRPWRRVVAEARLHMRALAAEWYLVREERVGLAPLNARGEDLELRRLFAPRRLDGRARRRRRATAGNLNKSLRTRGPFARGGDRPLSTTGRTRR